ncbi:MAG: TolC family protein [Nitrospirota bacterium]
MRHGAHHFGTIIAGLLLLAGSLCAAQEPLPLSLDDAIRRALENSLELQVARRSMQAAEPDVTVERAKFDPSLNVDLNGGRTNSASGTTNTMSADLSLDQPVLTGADLTLAFNNRWTETDSPFVSLQTGGSGRFYETDVALRLTQPLLRGGGMSVNRAPILIAANNAAISREALIQKTEEIVASVERAYWELVLAREIRAVREEALRAARLLLEAARAKVEQGQLAPIEALIAESEAASREEAVVVAERAVWDAQDRLRRFFTPSAETLTEESAIIPIDEPAVERVDIDLTALVEAALASRPELAQARLELANSRLNLKLAQNEQWPALDLSGSAGLNDLGRRYGDAVRYNEFYEWEAGLLLTVPLGNRAASATALKRRFELERAALTLKDREQSVILEVKEAARGLLANSKRVEATRQARRLAEKKLEAEQARFELGLTTVQDVLTFERDLAEAKRAHIQALIDYRNSLVDLDRRAGRLLERRRIAPLTEGAS